MISPFWAGEANRVPLIAEQQTTLHVGQVAVLQIPWTRRYVIDQSGNALSTIMHAHVNSRTVLYRATHTGNETLILAPAGLRSGQCVSCVTQHFFITVVP